MRVFPRLLALQRGTGHFTKNNWKNLTRLFGSFAGVRAPSRTDWSDEWRDILHCWNERVRVFVSDAGVPTWAATWCAQQWNLARRIASLPASRWVRRILRWTPAGPRRGRPRSMWTTKLEEFRRYKNLGNWKALDTGQWQWRRDDFTFFCLS